MATLGTVLTSVLMTTAGRIISSLGMSFITYTGFNAMQSYFVSWLSNQFNNFPSAAIQLVYIGGGGVALNWLFGAFAFVVSVKSVTKLSMGFSSK